MELIYVGKEKIKIQVKPRIWKTLTNNDKFEADDKIAEILLSKPEFLPAKAEKHIANKTEVETKKLETKKNKKTKPEAEE